MKSRFLGEGTRRFVATVAALVANPGAPLAALGVIAALGLALQLSRPLNHDAGWLLIATGRLLDGANVYVDDVVEWNPPLVLYLFSPAVAAARLLDLSEIASFRVYVLALGFASLWLCSRAWSLLVGRRGDVLGRYVLAVLGYLFLVFPDADFGQREHFVAILVTPYLIGLAVRAQPSALPAGLAAAVGVAAALGVLVKPQYALAVGLLELQLALRLRSTRVWWRVEIVSMAAVVALYAVSLFAVTPAYATFLVPRALDAYWAYQQPIGSLVRWHGLALVGLAGIAGLALRHRPPLDALGAVLGLAAFAFYAAMLAQGTGWRYSRLPYESAAIAGIALASFAWLARLAAAYAGPPAVATGLAARTAGAAGAAVLVGALLLAQPGLGRTLATGAGWRSGTPQGVHRQVTEMIEAHAAGGSVYFLSVGVAVAFPSVNYSEATWASRFAGLWPLSAVVRARAGDPRTPARFTPERIDAMERWLRDAVVEDLERYRPELVFVDLRRRHAFFGDVEVDVLGFFRRDPRFEAIWSQYTSLRKPLAFYEVFVRADAATAPAPPGPAAR